MSEKAIPYKIYLEENEMPRQWYNVRADMKNKPAPLLNPGTLEPMTAQELEAVFCKELVQQELDDVHPYIDIPEDIRNFYKMYRPQFCHCPGLLCQAAGPSGRYHRDGGRTVGNSPLHGMFLFWAGL